MRADQMLPDDTNQLNLQGTIVRKGTVGAFLVNARIWLDPATDPATREQAEADMRDGLPALRALGLFDVLDLRDAALREWVGRH